ncbi:DNA (cytosine-5-)-methyltransferase [Oscillospiraceae bacterium OttesenSCG-928-F05]|nr:DNA (cytosine-5-)-methyltransferase [Oscillospiraceae bacterium OttesenSCG-928-F05]
MTFLDIFSGIGGFRRGFEMAGHTCIGHIEIDKHADRSYRAIHDVKKEEFYSEDITLLKSNDIPRCDIWCFGFPCQDISIAGGRAGMGGGRSGLYFTVVELLKGKPPETRPRWLVAENVKHLLSINNGWDFFAVLSAMAEAGYVVEWAIYNTDFSRLQRSNENLITLITCVAGKPNLRVCVQAREK